MTNFEDFNLIVQNLVSYFTGDYVVLSILVVVVFVMVLLARGLDLRYASLFTLPLVGFFVAIGWFGTVGAASWIVNIVLLVVAVFYGLAVIKIST